MFTSNVRKCIYFATFSSLLVNVPIIFFKHGKRWNELLVFDIQTLQKN